MRNVKRVAYVLAVVGVGSFVTPAYPGGQLNEENGSGTLIGEFWDLSDALSNRSPGDGRTNIVHFAQGTASNRISAIQAAHASWEDIVAVDFDDVNNTLPFAPSNGAGGATPDGYNTHSFEFTLGCGGTLGITPTVYDANTGQIIEGDVFYEGNGCLNWSTDGSPSANQYELEGVAVHEMGHFLGLSHSGEIDSTMFPSVSPGGNSLEPVTLEPDDASSVTKVYGQDGGDTSVPGGGISGRVIDGSNSSDGKVCALVYAFSASEAPITNFDQAYVQVYSGSVVGASAASNDSGGTSGRYEINGLPDGDWFVLLDPIGNLVQAAQISTWCLNNSEAGFAQEWWNGIAESNAEGCLGCAFAVTVSGGQVTTGIDFRTETGTCSTTENPEVSCADGIDNDCDGFADSQDDDCQGGCTTNGDCDDGLFCNGAETCNAGSCQGGSDPCPGQSCDEVNDVCVPLVCNDDGDCDAGEDCNNCPNDCISPSCGDGVCNGNEDCVGCPGDCNGKQNGNPDNRFCCNADGTNGDGAVSCADSRCTSSGFACDASTYCCGDGTCEGAEDATNCAVDCATGCTMPADCDDLNDCTIDDCVGSVCSYTNVADNTACSGGVCCGGSCSTPACSINGDCDDGNSCTTDTCQNGGTCSASCDNAEPPCTNGDGCCPSGCSSSNDDDCGCLPKNANCSSGSECCSGICKANGRCR